MKGRQRRVRDELPLLTRILPCPAGPRCAIYRRSHRTLTLRSTEMRRGSMAAQTNGRARRWMVCLIAVIWALGIVALVGVTLARVHWHVATVITAGGLIWTFLFLWLVQLKYKLDFAEGIVSPLGLKGAQTGRCWRVRPIVTFGYYVAVVFGTIFLVRPVFHFATNLGWPFFPSAVATFAAIVGGLATLEYVLKRRLFAGPIFVSRRLRELLFFEVKRGE